MQANEHLAGLNDAQRTAVEHATDDQSASASPLLVIAGAGSGKTNTLAHRVAHLIVHGADAGRILLLTFSRRAAAEMTRRAERVRQPEVCERVLAGGHEVGYHGYYHEAPSSHRPLDENG